MLCEICSKLTIKTPLKNWFLCGSTMTLYGRTFKQTYYRWLFISIINFCDMQNYLIFWRYKSKITWNYCCWYPAAIYLLKVNNRNTRTRCEICSKLTIKTPERRNWRRSGVFIVNFEHISHFLLVFLLLTLNM